MPTKEISLKIAFVSIWLLLVIPVSAGFYFQSPGFSWTGIVSRNTADFNSYLSLVEEGRKEGLKARNLFTAEPHTPFQFRPIHVLMALAGRLLPAAQSVKILVITQILMSLIFMIVLVRIVSRLFRTLGDRVPAFLLICLGSGLGWSHLVHDPPDLRIVETSTFLTLLSPPIYTVSLSLILLILLTQWTAWDEQSIGVAVKKSFIPVLFAAWLGLERPFSLATLVVAIGGALLYESLHAKKFPSRMVLLSLPVFLTITLVLFYQYELIRSIPIYAAWSRQHVLRTPEAYRLLISLGLLVPLALYGLEPLMKSASRFGVLLLSYIFGSLVFSHLPFSFQERFLEGLPVCLSIIGSFGLIRLLHRFQSTRTRTIVAFLIIALMAPSSIWGLLTDVKTLAKKSPPQYLPEEVFEGMRALNRLAAAGEPILSSYAMGNFISAYSARPVVLGHSVATADFRRKWTDVNQFFQLQASNPKALKILRRIGADWIFWSSEEIWLAKDGFNPDEASFLNRMYNNSKVSIYRVVK